MVIWITGLSGSGKTTLAAAFLNLIKANYSNVVLIDGDVIREMFGPSLGYTEADRVIQIGRIQRLAKILNDQDLIVIVAALYAHPDLLNWNRINLNNYTEVYLKASMDLLRRRDQKNLYSKASKVQAANVVGIDIPWHAPTDFHLQFSADAEITPVDMARQLAAKLGLFDDGVVKNVGTAGS
jgi:adenylylsulfate kinase-like enzyme